MRESGGCVFFVSLSKFLKRTDNYQKHLGRKLVDRTASITNL